jgi:hypothetical protein
MRILIIKLIIVCLSTSVIMAQPFVDVSDMQGLNSGYGHGFFGGGISFCDFNQDGWDDLTFCTQKDYGLRFFINQEGSFQEIIPPVDNKEETKQVLWVDYDNDGDKDLYITAVNAANRLYRNDGDLDFTDVTTAAGLGLPHWNTYGAAFGDYDNDGWLDLYILNREIDLYSNFLYRNQGDGTFEEVSVACGVIDGLKPSFCAAFWDMNNDGLQDLYIAQDRYFHANSLYKNLGNGSFADISESSGSNLLIDAMNVGLGDYDNDGDFDIYVTNTAAGNKLLINQGDETFIEQADTCGVALYEVSWGANFFDYDNDGWLDLYVNTDQDTISNPLYRNLGGSAFELVTEHDNDFGRSYSNAIGDFNRDGKPDILVSNAFGTNFRLWENQVADAGNYIQIELEGLISNRDGIGCTIEVYAEGQKWIQYTYSGIAYLAQNSETTHIGLGNTSLIDSIKIKWLSGIVDQLDSVSVNQKLYIIEDSTNPPPVSTFAPERFTYAINQSYTQNDLLHLNIQSENRQALLLRLFDAKGSLVLQDQLQLVSGEMSYSIQLPELAKGIYFLQTQSGNTAVNQKVPVF